MIAKMLVKVKACHEDEFGTRCSPKEAKQPASTITGIHKSPMALFIRAFAPLMVVLKVRVFPQAAPTALQQALTKVNHRMLLATLANQRGRKWLSFRT